MFSPNWSTVSDPVLWSVIPNLTAVPPAGSAGVVYATWFQFSPAGSIGVCDHHTHCPLAFR
jgi:hypothetical protein